METSDGHIIFRSLNGKNIAPGITLIGEPAPVPGTDKLRCLANVCGCLAIVELRLKFSAPEVCIKEG